MTEVTFRFTSGLQVIVNLAQDMVSVIPWHGRSWCCTVDQLWDVLNTSKARRIHAKA